MTSTPFIPCYLPETPSQTAGPYVHIGLIPKQAGFEIFETNFSGDIAGPGVGGERIIIEGRIFDGAGHIAKDVLVETWQANAAGCYNHPSDSQGKAIDPGFRGWAQTGKRGRPQGPQDDGAARQFLAGLPRHQHWPRNTHVFRRRRGRKFRRPRLEYRRAARTSQNLDRCPIRTRRRHRLHIRHPSAGRSRDGFLRCLTRFLRKWRFCGRTSIGMTLSDRRLTWRRTTKSWHL